MNDKFCSNCDEVICVCIDGPHERYEQPGREPEATVCPECHTIEMSGKNFQIGARRQLDTEIKMCKDCEDFQELQNQ